MQFRKYQRAATRTDQNPRSGGQGRGPKAPKRSEVIPLLGLVGEVGGLVGEYKKLLRDGHTHRAFKDEVAEELGDILWYVANVATKFELGLDQIAQQNLTKTADRYLRSARHQRLIDAHYATDQRIPRTFEYEFKHRKVNGQRRLVLVDRASGNEVGDSLTDNTYEDSGYRYHDIMHLTFAAMLG